MTYVNYLIAVLKIIGVLKGLKIVVLIVEKKLEWFDLIDFRPFGADHLKIMDIAKTKTTWKKPIYKALLYSYSFFISILVVGAILVLIYNLIQSFS